MILPSFESRFCKNVSVLKQVKKTVAVFAFLDQQKAQLPAIRINEQPMQQTKSKINLPGYKKSS